MVVRALLLIMIWWFPLLVQGQIKVCFLNNGDSNSHVAGSGSDNRVRIKNLPENADVDLDYGDVEKIGADEFILCRFGDAREDSLKIFVNDKMVYGSYLKVKPTEASETKYNPLRIAGVGDIALSIGGQKPKTGYAEVTKDELMTAVSAGLKVQADTGCEVMRFSMGVLPVHGNYKGPYVYKAGTGNKQEREKECIEFIKGVLMSFNLAKDDKVFFGEINVNCSCCKQEARAVQLSYKIK